jgi:hypothetical protein
MYQDKEYLTIQEASFFAGKPEITIRRLVKRLLSDHHVIDNDHQSDHQVIITDHQTGRKINKINKVFLVKRFNIKEIITDNQSDHQVIINDNQVIDNDHQSDHQVTITQDFLETIKKQLETKDEEIKKLHVLIENQQKISLHTQMLLDKNMIQLEAKIEANERKERKKILWIF